MITINIIDILQKYPHVTSIICKKRLELNEDELMIEFNLNDIYIVFSKENNKYITTIKLLNHSTYPVIITKKYNEFNNETKLQDYHKIFSVWEMLLYPPKFIDLNVMEQQEDRIYKLVNKISKSKSNNLILT